MASKWWVACAALLTVFAGCMDDAPGADPAPLDDGDDLDGNQTAPPTNGTNTAPTASLEASVLNGTAPLNVTLTVDGGDADGDNLTWTLTVGNDTRNGSALPATVNVTLEAGNHTLTLLVSDGNATANATLVVTVEAGAAAPAGPCGGEPEPCVVGGDDYAIFWSDGRCDARPEQVFGAAGVYVHERGDPPGTGLLAGGGTWVYEEGNGIAGMQINGEFEGGDYADCLDGDIGVW